MQTPAYYDSRGYDSLFYEGNTGDLLGGFDGAVYALEDGPDDNGVAIPLIWQSRYLDQGAPNNLKTYQDLVIEHNTAGAVVNVTLVLDNGTRSLWIGDFQSSGEGKQQTVFRIESDFDGATVGGAQAKNCAILLEADAEPGYLPCAIFGIFLHYYVEARGRKHYDSDEFDCGTQAVKRIRAVELDLLTAHDLQIQIHSDLPGNQMGTRVQYVIPAGGSRRKHQVPVPDYVEGRHLRILIYSDSDNEWHLWGPVRVWVHPYGTYLENYESDAGQIYDSFGGDFGTEKVKRVQQLYIDGDSVGALPVKLYTSLANEELALRDTQNVVASTGRRPYIAPYTAQYGRILRWTITPTDALRLYKLRALLKPIGVYLNASSNEVFTVESEYDFRTERVKLFKEIEVVYDSAGAAGNLKFFTDLPDGTIAQVGSNYSLTATTGTQTIKLRLPPTAKGRLIRVECRPGAGDLQIFAIRVWVRVVGEAARADWQWLALPVPQTPDNYEWADLPVTPTAELPVWIELPVEM